MKNLIVALALYIVNVPIFGQDYFLKDYGPYDEGVPTPASFLGYDIGDYHTRHDRIVAYLEALDESSEQASLIEYGKSHELRRLVILQIGTSLNLENIENHRINHLKLVDPNEDFDPVTFEDRPVFVNLGYNVHGNEPSSSEAAMLTAYVLVASQHPDIIRLRNEAIVFLDPTINPDGRDRHTQWANTYRANNLSDDPIDAEHNEMWPRGRTNHYWFDLNRDWLLLVHPESKGKLQWYHQWYPNVVTDFHEMGSNSTYFFEPMKVNGSKDPIMPKENYTTLNDTFAKYFREEMDRIGTLYFTKEVFDGTYPGYGSSYPDIQGGLGILFEQASSRGHVQKTSMGKITFPYTIRNQFLNSLATVRASVDHKDMLFRYQNGFFKSAISNATKSGIKSYIFGEEHDRTRLNAFVELLLRHKVDVYKLDQEVYIGGKTYNPGSAFVVPTEQAQYRMVQTMFETYDEYQDSVFYDASAWSLANAYNIQYNPSSRVIPLGDKVSTTDLSVSVSSIPDASYAYLIGWEDYNTPAALYHLQQNKIKVMISQKEFSLPTTEGIKDFSFGTIVIPMQIQDHGAEKVKDILEDVTEKYNVKVFGANTGYSAKGVDLGSRYIDIVQKPKAIMLIGGSVSSYEAGFVWHLLDQRVNMPITKLKEEMFGRADLNNYNTMILVSGGYGSLDSTDVKKIKDWVAQGNTLITIGRATTWAIRNKLVNETLVSPEKPKDGEKPERYNYVEASEIRGKNSVGGAIFEVDIDITHPIGYGYKKNTLPMYRNNTVWVSPSKNEFSNIAMYTDDPHIDGFITDENLEKYLKKSTPIIASRIGSGRAVLFSCDPNFRGAWYGTNKLFLNAIFFGELIRIP